MMAIVAGVLLLFACGGAVAENEPPMVPKKLENRALDVLRDALANGREWVKVHAAESLVWTGHPERVHETFLKELDGAGPKYRIGVWRVLAQAAAKDDERRMYLAKIVDAFLDEDGPDRLHAVETLGKLGYTGRPKELVRVAREETGSFQAYARWVLANSGAEADEAALAALLESEEAGVRGCAAYAFRFFERLRPPSCAKLQAAAERVPRDSGERVYLLSAYCVHAPEDARPRAKTELASYAENGGNGEKREACCAFGRVPSLEDVPLLRRLLEDEEMDVRAGAAEALLRIAQS